MPIRQSKKFGLLKQITLPRFSTPAEVFVCKRHHLATAWRTLDETLFDKERLVDLLDSARIFAQGSSNGIEPHGTAVELVDNRQQYLIVYLVETVFVDIESFERIFGYRKVDIAIAANLSKVAYAT